MSDETVFIEVTDEDGTKHRLNVAQIAEMTQIRGSNSHSPLRSSVRMNGSYQWLRIRESLADIDLRIDLAKIGVDA